MNPSKKNFSFCPIFDQKKATKLQIEIKNQIQKIKVLMNLTIKRLQNRFTVQIQVIIRL